MFNRPPREVRLAEESTWIPPRTLLAFLGCGGWVKKNVATHGCHDAIGLVCGDKRAGCFLQTQLARVYIRARAPLVLRSRTVVRPKDQQELLSIACRICHAVVTGTCDGSQKRSNGDRHSAGLRLSLRGLSRKTKSCFERAGIGLACSGTTVPGIDPADYSESGEFAQLCAIL